MSSFAWARLDARRVRVFLFVGREMGEDKGCVLMESMKLFVVLSE